VVQRGNNRQAVFFHPSDFRWYLEKLFESAARYDVAIHAFVLMTNHVHLLATPDAADGVSRMMQRLGMLYAASINNLYNRSGSLWEGRFKSSLVESDRYCLACYRYIEMNPVRAGLARYPANYRWSSYRCNALGKEEYPVEPHGEWLALGPSNEERRARYRALIEEQLEPDLVDRFRNGTNTGQPTGSGRFQSEIESELSVRLSGGRRGRPKKGL
jgi:putative transposase